MSEIRRLREESSSPLLRELLDSARIDRSEPGACDRAVHAVTGALAAAAVVGAASTTHAATAAATAGTTGAATGSIAPTAVKGGGLLLKWLAVAAVSGAAAGGAAHLVRTPLLEATSPASAKPSTSAHVPPPRSLAPADETRSATAADSATVAPMELVDVRSLPKAPASASAAIQRTHPAMTPVPESVMSAETTARVDDAPPAPPHTVSEQVTALAEIRAALDAHAPTRALTLLDAFDQTHPSSPLRVEATVLRIDALADAQQKEAARALARSFLRDHPGSAYREHVQNKVDLGDQSGTPGH